MSQAAEPLQHGILQPFSVFVCLCNHQATPAVLPLTGLHSASKDVQNKCPAMTFCSIIPNLCMSQNVSVKLRGTLSKLKLHDTWVHWSKVPKRREMYSSGRLQCCIVLQCCSGGGGSHFRSHQDSLPISRGYRCTVLLDGRAMFHSCVCSSKSMAKDAPRSHTKRSKTFSKTSFFQYSELGENINRINIAECLPILQE